MTTPVFQPWTAVPDFEVASARCEAFVLELAAEATSKAEMDDRFRSLGSFLLDRCVRTAEPSDKQLFARVAAYMIKRTDRLPEISNDPLPEGKGDRIAENLGVGSTTVAELLALGQVAGAIQLTTNIIALHMVRMARAEGMVDYDAFVALEGYNAMWHGLHNWRYGLLQ